MPEIGNTAVFSQTDANNNTGTMPSWLGSAAPSTIDDAGRAFQGAVTREWNWRNFTLTAGGTADAKTLTYSVAPAAYYTGQIFCFIANTTNTGTATLNVNSLGAKTIKKDVSGTMTVLAASDMVSGMRVMLAYDGTDMIWINRNSTPGSATTSAEGIVELATTTEVLTSTDTTRAVTVDALAALWEKGSNVASAGTISLGEGGYFHVTGTTTITDIDFATAVDGRGAWVIFDGALTLTHNGTTLLLPGAANITTAANDRAHFVQDSADNIICTSYIKANGQAVVTGTMTLISTLTTTSGTTHSVTGIGSTYRKLYCEIEGVSFDAAATLAVAASGNNGTNYGTPTNISPATGGNSGVINGSIELVGIRNTGSQYSCYVHPATSEGTPTQFTTVALVPKHATGASNAVDAIQFSGGTFDAGTIRVYGIA